MGREDAPDLGAQSFEECYCGDPLTLDHECYHWPPKACDCEHCAKGVRVDLPYLRALWQDRQAQAARLAAVEQAGRQWQAAAARTRPYDGELMPWKLVGWQDAMDALVAAEAALEAALAALDAPPGAGA